MVHSGGVFLYALLIIIYYVSRVNFGMSSVTITFATLVENLLSNTLVSE